MNFRQKKRYASRLETASVIKIATENGRVRYGTVRYGTVRYATVRYGTVRYGTVLRINSDPLLYSDSFNFETRT